MQLQIKLTFSEAVYKDTGADLTSSYVENSVVELREGSVDGPLKSFSAVISSTRKLITITPDSDLKDDTVYYVIVNKETLSDYDGNLNSRFTSVFSTGSTVDALISFDPENKEENVLPDTDITISFAYALQRYGGTPCANPTSSRRPSPCAGALPPARSWSSRPR